MSGDARDAVRRTVAADADALLQLASRYPDRYPLFLDSASRGPHAQRHLLFRARGEALRLLQGGRMVGVEASAPAQRFIDTLQRKYAARAIGGEPSDAWLGGWALFLGYEWVRELEPTLRLPSSPDPYVAAAIDCPVRLQADLASGAITLSSAPQDLRELEAAVLDLQSLERLPKGRPIADLPLPLLTEEPPQRYAGAIDAAKRYIAAGDIYQANLSRLWRGAWAAAVAEFGGIEHLYRALRAANPGPFAALFQHSGMAVLSSSPERLLRVRGRQLSTRPIAGTRPRSGRFETATTGLTPNVAAETAALVSHPKERAEHIMLIDLERNDLGRVAVAGSVVVDEFMVTETYAHVHHIVSNVSAELRPELTPLDALAALFPGGTITGVPKYRCMQIIAELEGVGRGAYTGSVGYLGVDGSMDVNILIRSMVYSGGELRLRAGGGIVADSDPQRELQETRAKARGMLRALGIES